MYYTVTLLLFEKSPKHKNIKQITVELELGFEEDDDEEDMMLLEPIPDYHRSWLRVYNVLYFNAVVVWKEFKA